MAVNDDEARIMTAIAAGTMTDDDDDDRSHVGFFGDPDICSNVSML